jgi:hypothetical protein
MSAEQTIQDRKGRRAVREPAAISELISELQTKGLRAHAIDAPKNENGEWFMDLTFERFHTTIGYRADAGFGVFTSEGLYGGRPDEVFREPRQAAIRVLQLAQQWAKNARLRSPGLRDLRHIVEQPQTRVAAALGGDQASISRLEMRDDHKLSTIADYVRALGGDLELRVRFGSFETPIHIGRDDEHSSRARRASSHEA